MVGGGHKVTGKDGKQIIPAERSEGGEGGEEEEEEEDFIVRCRHNLSSLCLFSVGRNISGYVLVRSTKQERQKIVGQLNSTSTSITPIKLPTNFVFLGKKSNKFGFKGIRRRGGGVPKRQKALGESSIVASLLSEQGANNDDPPQ